MGFAEEHDERSRWILLKKSRHAARNTFVAASYAAEVAPRVVVEGVDRDCEIPGRFEKCSVARPVAPPLLDVSDLFQEFTFTDSAAHPPVENLLMPCENNFNPERNLGVFLNRDVT